MKKLSVIITLLMILSLLLCSTASADTITALAIEVNPEHLEKTASYARILGYNSDSNTLIVELIAPETFPREDIQALKAGDSIYTGGREVKIRSIDENEWGTYYLNEGEDSDSFVFLTEDLNGNYRTGDEGDDYVWSTVAVIECPVTEKLLFLDGIDENSGDMLELPVIHSADELVNALRTTDASDVFTVGLSTNNVYVVFDGEGNLAVIHRFYVSWQ